MHLNNLINKKAEIMECIQNKLADAIYKKFGGVVLEAKSFDDDLSQKESDAIWDKIYSENPDISPEDADKKYKELYEKELENYSMGPQTEDEKDWMKQEDEEELPKQPSVHSLTNDMVDFLKRKREGKSLEKKSPIPQPVVKLRNSRRYINLVNDKNKAEEESVKKAGENLEQARTDRDDAAKATQTYSTQVKQLAQHLVNIGKYKNIADATKALTDATKSQRDAFIKRKQKSADDLETKASNTSLSQYSDRDPNYTVTDDGVPDILPQGAYIRKGTGKRAPANYAVYPDENEAGKEPFKQHHDAVVKAWNARQKKNGSGNTVASIKQAVASGKVDENNPPEDFFGSKTEWKQMVQSAQISAQNDKINKDKQIASDIKNGTGVKEQSKESRDNLLASLKKKVQQTQRKLNKENWVKANIKKSDGYAHPAPTEETPDKLTIAFDGNNKTEGEGDNKDVKATFKEVPWKQGESTEDIAKRLAKLQGTDATITSKKGERVRLGRPAKTNPTRVVKLPEEIIHNTKMMLSEMIRESFNIFDALPKEMQDDIINSSGASDKHALKRALRNIGTKTSKKIKDFENSVQGTYDKDLSDAYQTDLTRRALETHDDNAEKSSHRKNSDKFTLSVFRHPQHWRSTHYSADASGRGLSEYEGELVSGRKKGGETPQNSKEAGNKIKPSSYKLDYVRQLLKKEHVEYDGQIVENSDDTNIRAWVSGKNRVGIKVDRPQVSPENLASDVGSGGLGSNELSSEEVEAIQDIFGKALKASRKYKEPKKEPPSIIPTALMITDKDTPEVREKKLKTSAQIVQREKEKRNKLESDKRVKDVLDNLTNNPSISGEQKKEYAKRAYNKFPELFKQELAGHNILDSQKKALESASGKKVNWGKKEQPKEQVPHTPVVGANPEQPNKFKGAKPSEHFTLPRKNTRYLDVDKLLADFERNNPTTDFGQKLKKAMDK